MNVTPLITQYHFEKRFQLFHQYALSEEMNFKIKPGKDRPEPWIKVF